MNGIVLGKGRGLSLIAAAAENILRAVLRSAGAILAVLILPAMLSLLPTTWQGNKLVQLFAINEAKAATRIQFVAAGSNGATATLAATWPAATTAGNLLVAILARKGDGATDPTPPAGLGWTKAVEQANGTNFTVFIYYIENAASQSGTSTWAWGSTVEGTLTLMEYSGIAASAALDKIASTFGDSATGNTGTTATTAQANELLIGAISAGDAVTFSNPTNSFAIVSQVSSLDGGKKGAPAQSTVALDRVVSAVGTYSTAATLSASKLWAGAIATFREAITTLGNGTDPSNSSIAPSGAATLADALSFQTNGSTDVITAATVTLAAGTSGGLSLVEITNAAGTTVYGSVANPASDTPAITLSTNTLTATTTLTEYRIRVTPKTHANMPVPPGSTYSVTARISAFTGTNSQSGSDTAGTTVTIDNLSTANVTASTATAGNTQVSLAWTNPADADFNSIVVLRRASSAVADVPAEGSTYVVGNTIGTATVACVVASPGTSCTDTGLTNGTAYHYKIFAKDSNGNYSTGVIPTGSPATPVAPSLTFLKTVAVTSDPFNGTTNPKYIPGAEALFTMRVTNSGAGMVDNNTMVITDPIPANTELFTGNLSGGAPHLFADGTPTSGLSCPFIALANLTDCVDFSNNSGVSWTYVPNGSFDPAVTNVRFSLSGAMNADTGGGSPYFDLSFRVRVK